MRSFTNLALLALPLFGAVFAEEPASPTKEVDSIYSNAQEAFRDLLNALPEESLQAALSGLKDFKHGIFESHHRGVEQVHNKNPALATKLIVAAVQDLKKRQTPSNGTTPSPPPPPQDTSVVVPPPQQSSGNNEPTNTPANPPAQTTDRGVIIPVEQTTTNQNGQTIIQTSSILSEVTASVPVTRTLTSAGRAITTTEQRPAVIRTTTDAQGRASVITSAAQFAPTAGEVRTEVDGSGNTFTTTYTPGGGKISSIKLITTTGEDGRPSTLTSYAFVDPAEQTGGAGSPTTGSPGLQTNAAGAVHGGINYGYAVAAGGMLAWFV